MILVLISLFSFSSVADNQTHLSLINGDWSCLESLDEGDLTGIIKSKYTYDSTNLSYVINVDTEFTYQDKTLFGVINIVEKGTFSYKSSKMVYTPQIVDAKVLEDPFGYFTAEIVEDMKRDLLEEDKTEYQTISINKLEWETLDPTDSIKSVCMRDITRH